MTDLTSLGRMVMVLGVVLLLAGGLMTLMGRGFRLPGDILIRRSDDVTVFLKRGIKSITLG